jgi:hypothetical protein
LCDTLADEIARRVHELNIQQSEESANSEAPAAAAAEAAPAVISAAEAAAVLKASQQNHQQPAESAAAAAETTATEATVLGMQGTLWGLTTATLMLLSAATHVLTRLQVAKLIVATYPHLPHVGVGRSCHDPCTVGRWLLVATYNLSAACKLISLGNASCDVNAGLQSTVCTGDMLVIQNKLQGMQAHWVAHVQQQSV